MYNIVMMMLGICLWILIIRFYIKRKEDKRKKHQDMIDGKTNNAIVLDLETTGLNPEKDEILKISIIDNQEKVLFDELIKPLERKRWNEAQAINGITLKMVENARTIPDVYDEINKILSSYEYLIGYNIRFDISFLKENRFFKFPKNIIDVMELYSEYKNVKDNYYGGLKYFKLEECAREFHYKFKAHDSLEDCKATLYCMKQFVHS